MREKVGNNELRFALFFAEADFNLSAVTQNNNSVKRHRNRRPLIFLDSAVVMRFQQAKTAVFVKRAEFEVKSGAVNVRRNKVETFFKRCSAYRCKNRGMTFLDVIYLVSRRILFAVFERNKTRLFSLRNGIFHAVVFDFRSVEKFFVIFAKSLRRYQFFFTHGRERFFLFETEFTHFIFPP